MTNVERIWVSIHHCYKVYFFWILNWFFIGIRRSTRDSTLTEKKLEASWKIYNFSILISVLSCRIRNVFAKVKVGVFIHQVFPSNCDHVSVRNRNEYLSCQANTPQFRYQEQWKNQKIAHDKTCYFILYFSVLCRSRPTQTHCKTI